MTNFSLEENAGLGYRSTHLANLIRPAGGRTKAAHEVWKKVPQSLLTSKGDGKWQSITKNCQRALTGKKLKQGKSKQKQSKQKTQFEWGDQSDKHSLIKGLEIKLNLLI